MVFPKLLGPDNENRYCGCVCDCGMLARPSAHEIITTVSCPSLARLPGPSLHPREAEGGYQSPAGRARDYSQHQPRASAPFIRSLLCRL